MIGKTLAHYEITGLLGKGGMGEVYRARDTKLGREVALKFLPTDFAKDPDRLHRFEREARLLASLSHPNIGTIHGFEEDGDHRFLVLELVEGADLSVELAQGSIPTRQVLSIACQIAEGMEAAHAQGIIHRDLKPANIKQTTDGSIKVLDFGLARVNDPDDSSYDIENSPTITMDHTRDGTLLGTALYMSPEQLKGQAVDARSDIWSFGCILYEMLTGSSPFSASSSPEIMAKTLGHEPDFSELSSDLPASVARLVRRCLAKDPHLRLHSAADIRIVLQEAAEAGPETAAPLARRQGFWTPRTAIVAIVAFALGALTVGLATRQSGPTTDTVRDSARLMIPVRDDAAVVPMPETSSAVISPDGRFVVYVAASNLGGMQTGEAEFSSTQLYRRPIDGFDSTPIEGTSGGSSPFFSPDGEWVAFMNYHDGVLKKVALGGGAPQTICFVQELTFRGGHWAEDGNIYYANSSEMARVDADGGDPQIVARPDHQAGEKTYRLPDVLPGSRALLFTRGSSEILSYDDADIALLDLESGEIRVLAQGGLDPQYVPTGHIIFGRAGRVLALPFDLDRLEVTGSPVDVLDDVVTSEGYGSMQLSCSDDGTLVYIAGGPEQFSTQIMILHADGRVEDLAQPSRPYGNLSISPDAERVAVSVLGANASLWIYELQRGTMTKLVSGWDNYSPIWNGSKDEIAFGSNRGGNNGIWLTSSDGTGSPVRLLEREAGVFPNSWSPDGQSLLVSSLSASTGMDIWITDRGGNARPAIQSVDRELHGRFSPNGEYVAYSSNESGRLEIYVQAFPITGRKWKLSEDGGDLPLWSREGDKVYYWSGQRLMMVEIQTVSGFKPARARQLLQAAVEVHDYDVFPGGEKFLVIGRVSMREGSSASISYSSAQGRLFPAQSPDLHVVLNWFDELERLAPGR